MTEFKGITIQNYHYLDYTLKTIIIFRVSAKGVPVVYTNWMPGRMSIFHNNEDCVGLGVHAYQGHWEDLTCHMELHYICEFGKLLCLGISTCHYLRKNTGDLGIFTTAIENHSYIVCKCLHV